MREGRLLAIYDGQCTICEWARRIATSLDWRGRLAFTDLHDRDTIQLLLPGLSQADSRAALHLLLEDGRILRGFEAIRRLLGELPLLTPLAWVLYVPPLESLGRLVYRLVAQNRPCHPHQALK